MLENVIIACIVFPIVTWFFKRSAAKKGETFSWEKDNIITKNLDKRTFHCPHCKRRVPNGATVCGYCTRDIS
jgi:hypothetical protein